MFTRKETWSVCKKHIEASGVPEEELWGTTVFYQTTVQGLCNSEDRSNDWECDTLRDKFSAEGLELLFQITDELMPGVDHRCEHEHAHQNITPEKWANEAKLRELDKKISALAERIS